jgi:hypothetical protein
MHPYRIVEWYQKCSVVISCYCLMFKPYWKKIFSGEDDRHIMFLISPISSYCYGLMKTLFFGTTFNAVSLEVPSTCPPKCANIILIRSSESPMWYFTSILLFHIQKLFNCFSKYVSYLVAHICVNSCFHSRNEKISSEYQEEQTPMMLVARTQTLNLKLIN